MNKYRSKKITRDGITFDSIKEYRRFCELRLLEKAGQITNLERQVKFVLIPKQKDKQTGKVIERECSYIADFVYEVPTQAQYINDEGHLTFADGYETVVEDVKGYKQSKAYDIFVIKRKLMLHVHGIRIKEI